MVWRNAAAGPAMEEHGGLAAAFTDTFEVDGVSVAYREPAGLVVLDRWVQGSQVTHP